MVWQDYGINLSPPTTGPPRILAKELRAGGSFAQMRRRRGVDIASMSCLRAASGINPTIVYLRSANSVQFMRWRRVGNAGVSSQHERGDGAGHGSCHRTPRSNRKQVQILPTAFLISTVIAEDVTGEVSASRCVQSSYFAPASMLLDAGVFKTDSCNIQMLFTRNPTLAASNPSLRRTNRRLSNAQRMSGGGRLDSTFQYPGHSLTFRQRAQLRRCVRASTKCRLDHGLDLICAIPMPLAAQSLVSGPTDIEGRCGSVCDKKRWSDKTNVIGTVYLEFGRHKTARGGSQKRCGMSDIIYSNRLIRKSEAPVCRQCGRRLWRAHWEKRYSPEHPSERLGMVRTHRVGPQCFNVKLCIKRTQAQGAA